ncbi:hypothetical protein COHA_005100 [Chlorella ohadii]|uniref:RING-type domain-containing protein n=1 Tax=Chlorella ohadii TaxID=2649997 RepID=A0AAD5H5M4_9CHLO|nr:hypothetical protein COHA_005100 [Chlorella ohadii]
MDAEQHRCVICLSSPPHEPATVKGCSCGHEFCLACLEQWCRTRRQPKCPLCQHAIEHIICGGSEQEAPPPDGVEEEGPDLRCLDHSFFSAESDRLLCRARAAQMHLVRSAYGCGRSGSSAADDASDTLQQVIDTLAGYKDDMQHEVPFEPESVLHELYSLEQIVSSIAAGSWAGSGGGGGDAQLPARFSADDAAAGLQGWHDHSGASADSWLLIFGWGCHSSQQAGAHS